MDLSKFSLKNPELENSLKCKICLKILQNPKVDECGHSFCNLCLYNLLKKKFICPISKKKIEIQKCIPNLFLQNLLQNIEIVCVECKEIVKMKKNNSHIIKCQLRKKIKDKKIFEEILPIFVKRDQMEKKKTILEIENFHLLESINYNKKNLELIKNENFELKQDFEKNRTQLFYDISEIQIKIDSLNFDKKKKIDLKFELSTIEKFYKDCDQKNLKISKFLGIEENFEDIFELKIKKENIFLIFFENKQKRIFKYFYFILDNLEISEEDSKLYGETICFEFSENKIKNYIFSKKIISLDIKKIDNQFFIEIKDKSESYKKKFEFFAERAYFLKLDALDFNNIFFFFKEKKINLKKKVLFMFSRPEIDC